MNWRFWNWNLYELADRLYDAVVKFWREEVWPLFMGLSFFFALAIPLLLVLAVFWYLNEIHWEPEHGRYKVGLASACSACTTSAALTSAGVVRHAAWSASAASPPAVSNAIV